MWDTHSMLRKLEEARQEAAKHDARTVEVDAALFSTAVERFREAQEQLSMMKPSFVKGLNERICMLESELSHTRVASKIADLEKKLARTEAELRQGHKYTLKRGLLDIERRHKDFIYGSQETEGLWGEVLALVEGGRDAEPRTAGVQRVKPSMATDNHCSKGTHAGTVHGPHHKQASDASDEGADQTPALMPDAPLSLSATARANGVGDEIAGSTSRGAEIGGSGPDVSSPLARHTSLQEQGVHEVQGRVGSKSYDGKDVDGWDMLELDEHDIKEVEAAETAARAKQVEARGFAGLF